MSKRMNEKTQVLIEIHSHAPQRVKDAIAAVIADVFRRYGCEIRDGSLEYGDPDGLLNDLEEVRVSAVIDIDTSAALPGTVYGSSKYVTADDLRLRPLPPTTIK